MAISVYDIVGNSVCSPPIIYQELQKIIDDPDAEFNDFADIISSDPALAGQLLKIANSAYYGLTAKVETITHALSIVGMQQLSDMAFSAVVINQFQGISRELIRIEDFWRHSIACGVAARNIAKKRGDFGEEKFYLAGMLHDIGTLVVCKAEPRKAESIFRSCRDTGESLTRAEVEELGFDHSAMGSVLLKGWKLPEILVEAVSYHHSPMLAKEHPVMAATVHVADVLVHEMGLGNNGEPKTPELKPKAVKLLGLDKAFIQEIQKNVQEQAEEVFSIFMK